MCFRLRNLLLTVTSLIFFDFTSFYKNKIEAQNLRKISSKELNTIYHASKLNNFDEEYKFSNQKNKSKRELIKSLNKVNNQISNLLADEKQDINEDFEEADEVFMTGNMTKIMPVTAFEDKNYQVGSIAKLARELYWDWSRSQTL